MKYTIVIFLMLIAGCATQHNQCNNYSGEQQRKCQADIREWRQGIDQINWELCERTLNHYTIVVKSDHSHHKFRPHRPHEIKADLRLNNCRSVLQEHWSEY